MDGVTKFFNNFTYLFKNVDFGLLVIIDFSAFALIFLSCVLACALSPTARAHKKKAFMWVVNLFTAVTLSIFISEYEVEDAVAISCIFWCIGVLFYGALLLFNLKKKKSGLQSQQFATTANTYAQSRAPLIDEHSPTQSLGSVRLDHASSIADKLLLKNLGRGDRQELEKIKTTLNVYKVKGNLSVQEGNTLNEMFNALLKLMAKYEV